MASSFDRRKFFRHAAELTGAAVIAPSLAGLASCTGPTSDQRSRIRKAEVGFGAYGDLKKCDSCPEIMIPEGFEAVKVSTSRAASLCDENFKVPIAMDGMAAFPVSEDKLRLVRNQEIQDLPPHAVPLVPSGYDPKAGGGTTTLQLHIIREGQSYQGSGHQIIPACDVQHQPGDVIGLALEREFASLGGTFQNCSGGPTPWGSWLSCEETTFGVDKGLTQPHGYIFEVPSSSNVPAAPVPLKAMGRFTHEAVAVDPRTGFVYETEDHNIIPSEDVPGSGFYRFIPNENGNLRAGGRLQVLAVADRPNYNSSTGQTPGMTLPVTWVDIEDPDPANAEADPSAVFKEGLHNGAAIFQRIEGCFYGDGNIYFISTTGGDAGLGQVWQYRPSGTAERQMGPSVAGTLSLLFESPHKDFLEHPDNMTVSQRGGLVLCEDSAGYQFLRGLTPRGEIFDLVRTSGDSTEFSGATFSPEGDVLFFNIQGATVSDWNAVGHTFAMWGPWERGAL